MSARKTLVILTTPYLFFALTLMGCSHHQNYDNELTSSRNLAFEQYGSFGQTSKLPKQKSTYKLSLALAMKMAISNNKTLKASHRNKEASLGHLLATERDLLPKVRLHGACRRKDDLDHFGEMKIGARNDFSVGLEISRSIFRENDLNNGIKKASLLVTLSEEELSETIERTLFFTTKAYYDLQLAKKLVTVTESALHSAKLHLHQVTCKRKSGAATDYKVLRARVDSSLYEAELIERKNAQKNAKLALCRHIGLPSHFKLQLTDGLQYIPVTPQLTKHLKVAFENRPDLRKAQTKISLSKIALSMSKSQFKPHLFAFARGLWSRPDPHYPLVDDWGKGSTLGIAVEVPLFEQKRKEGNLQEAHSLLEKNKYELHHKEELCELELRIVIAKILDAEKLIQSQNMNVLRAKEGLRLAEAGYKEGVNTEIDVMDARSTLTKALALHHKALHQHIIAKLELDECTGTLAKTHLPKGEKHAELHKTQTRTK